VQGQIDREGRWSRSSVNKGDTEPGVNTSLDRYFVLLLRRRLCFWEVPARIFLSVRAEKACEVVHSA
jgi:hypothetical protein